MAALSKSSGRASRAVVQSEFNAAIDRLILGKPNDVKLREIAASGRLTISYATVAQEAGRSRSLIAHKNCAYQEIRSRVVGLMVGAATERPTSKDKVARMRLEIGELKEKLAAALDAQAEHFHARERAEREANKWREAFKRAKDDTSNVTTIGKR